LGLLVCTNPGSTFPTGRCVVGPSFGLLVFHLFSVTLLGNTPGESKLRQGLDHRLIFGALRLTSEIDPFIITCTICLKGLAIGFCVSNRVNLKQQPEHCKHWSSFVLSCCHLGGTTSRRRSSASGRPPSADITIDLDSLRVDD